MKIRFARAMKFFDSQDTRGNPMVPIGRYRLRCSHCRRAFRTASRALRFCKSCQGERETLSLAEGLPNT